VLSYGSSSDDFAVGRSKLRGTPVIPREMQIMSLLPFPNGPDIGLYLDKSKFHDVLQRHKEIRLGRMRLGAEAADYIYKLTLRHAGMVKGLLHFFNNVSTVKPLNFIYLLSSSTTVNT
jgi:hypothetical protein